MGYERTIFKGICLKKALKDVFFEMGALYLFRYSKEDRRIFEPLKYCLIKNRQEFEKFLNQYLEVENYN